MWRHTGRFRRGASRVLLPWRARRATLTVTARDGARWTITLWTKNLLDEAHEERVFLFDNFDPDGQGEQRYQAPAEPRNFGVTVNYSW